MRGIVHTFSRLPSARVLIAGAAILAGAFTSAAHGQPSGSGNGNGTTPSDSPRGDEAALVVPHFAGSTEVALPRPLSAQDAAVMQRVFAAQAHGDVLQAVHYCSELNNPLLLGNALADRYLGRYHRASVTELTQWLAHYPDLPDAPAIHTLLASRLPKGATLPPAPRTNPLPKYVYHGPETEPDGIARDPVLDRTVLDRAAHGATTLALRQLASRKGLPQAYAQQLRAEIAQQLFIRNEDAAALSLAQNLLRGSSPPALAFYIGGLSAWRLGRFDIAQTMFEGGATATDASPRLRAASAFWASRAARPLLDAAETVKWLNVAAAEKLTFYGLIARKILRLDTEIIPQNQTISQADIDAVAATPGGRRAFALLQIGQNERAERELRELWTMACKDPVFGRSLMMVASFVGMSDLAAQMADLLQDQEQDDAAAALPRLPVPRLRPAGGFQLDPPLVYALARVESNFDPSAISAAGARGLLQIMPETAQFITGNVTFSAEQLHEPGPNLAIGQRYLASLAAIDGIGDDLIRILASYNAGPGNVLRWLPAMHDQDDPLLFIETIPVAETRAFVPAALTYAWLYAAQMHLPSPSLDAMAAGEFPRFTPENQESRMAAALN